MQAEALVQEEMGARSTVPRRLKARTYNRVAMYDFDGTLFRSWEKTPEWWPDQTPYSFFMKPESLDSPCVPHAPGSDYWISNAVQAALKDTKDRNTFSVLITGRVRSHQERVKELLAQKGIVFDMMLFNPGMSASKFKTLALGKLLAGHNTVSEVAVWENENQSHYAQYLDKASQVLGREVKVDVHSIQDAAIPLTCGPQDFDLAPVFREKFAAVPKKYAGIDFKPPAAVAAQAKKGLEYRKRSGKGGLSSQEAGKEGIGSGVQRAVNLKNRNNLTPETIGMMLGFFSRHEKNKSIAPENKKTPWEDAGYVAWLLWGGDEGRAWAEGIKKEMEEADGKEAKSASPLRLQRDYGSSKQANVVGTPSEFAALQAELARRVSQKTATTEEIWELSNLKKKLYLLDPPEYMWHETDRGSAVGILAQGFVPGSMSGKGETSVLVYGHPKESLTKRDRTNYARGGPAVTVRVDLKGLRLLNYFAIPYVLDVPSYEQPRHKIYRDMAATGKLPQGFDGLYKAGVEVALKPEIANARIEKAVLGARGQVLKKAWGPFLNPKLASESGNSTEAGVFIPLPPELAAQFPPLSKDSSKPHATLLYVGDVRGREALFESSVREFFLKERGPVLARLSGVDYFTGQGTRVAYSRVHFSTDMGALRDRLASRLADKGFVVENSFPLAFFPHVTLEYMDDPAGIWKGPVPVGEWHFHSVSLWGLPEVIEIPFSEGLTPGTSPYRVFQKREASYSLFHNYFGVRP